MSRVDELLPGDRVECAGMNAVFIARTAHPIWPQLDLVVWRKDDGSWSHDALDPRQEVGYAQPATAEARTQRLHQSLLGSLYQPPANLVQDLMNLVQAWQLEAGQRGYPSDYGSALMACANQLQTWLDRKDPNRGRV